MRIRQETLHNLKAMFDMGDDFTAMEFATKRDKDSDNTVRHILDRYVEAGLLVFERKPLDQYHPDGTYWRRIPCRHYRLSDTALKLLTERVPSPDYVPRRKPKYGKVNSVFNLALGL